MANVDIAGQYKRIMRFFWDPEPRNDDPLQGPIWCLGISYPACNEALSVEAPTRSDRTGQSDKVGDELDHDTVMVTNRQPEHSSGNDEDSGSEVMVASAPASSEEERGWPPRFLSDFESRLWFTYRSHFPPIRKSTEPNATSSLSLAVRLRSQLVEQTGFTSDTGWGCMIRSGQCLIANALQLLRLGRDWRRGDRVREERELLSLFADDPRAPFSLHRFVEHGAIACGKHPGEWFGPSATARCIQALSRAYPDCGLDIYVTGDGADVYEDELFRLARRGEHEFQPVLILVGIRLGIDRVNPVYWDALKRTLQLPQSIGIAGGRPSASHYFVGVQSDSFFFLDPHQTRPMLAYHDSPDSYSAEEINSCHTRRLRRLHVESMDPSMLIGFLIRDKEDWYDWKRAVSSVQGKPVLHVAETEPAPPHMYGYERSSALDEVEVFDDDEPE